MLIGLQYFYIFMVSTSTWKVNHNFSIISLNNTHEKKEKKNKQQNVNKIDII